MSTTLIVFIIVGIALMFLPTILSFFGVFTLKIPIHAYHLRRNETIDLAVCDAITEYFERKYRQYTTMQVIVKCTYSQQVEVILNDPDIDTHYPVSTMNYKVLNLNHLLEDKKIMNEFHNNDVIPIDYDRNALMGYIELK